MREWSYVEESWLEEAAVELLSGFARSPNDDTHVFHPELARSVVHLLDVAKQLVRLDLSPANRTKNSAGSSHP